MRTQHTLIVVWALSIATLLACSSSRRNALQDVRTQAMSAGYRGDSVR